MNRREFIAAGLSTIAVPFIAEAQQTGKVHRVGWLDYSSSRENLSVFEQAMGARGWPEGKRFKLEYRGGDGRFDRLSAVAANLVKVPVDVIVAPGTSEVLAAKQATTSIPVVMSGVDDPVGRGLVASLARPGGNITGLANAREELSGKLLSFVQEIIPRASSVAVLWDSNDPEHQAILGHFQRAAKTLGVPLDPVRVERHTDVEPAIIATKKRGSRMLVVPLSTMLIPKWIADLAVKHGLPLASNALGHVYAGGLIAYTDDRSAVFERMAMFVDRILRGAKPADLPVELPTKFRLIVNAKSAERLGLAVPPSIMLRADYVVE